jgi:uncharacterized membrane protein
MSDADSERTDPVTGHRDEVFVHRLEAFSDIVMGLAVTELGASLVMTPHPQALLNDMTWIGAFAWTFTVICISWWTHYRVFRHAFFPDRASVVVNFFLLATIVLLAYISQVFNHSDQADRPLAMTMYVVLLAANLFASAFLALYGGRIRKPAIPHDAYVRSMGAGARLITAGAIMLISVAAIPHLFTPQWQASAIGTAIGVSFMIGNRASRIVMNRIAA